MEFGILGPLAVRSEHGPVAIGGAKARALLALLLLEREGVSAERLALGLFGEDAPPGAIKTVRVHVSRLRKALGDPDALATTTAGYRLRVRPGELDAERFEQLAEAGRTALAAGEPRRAAEQLKAALALWRGPALADVDVLVGEATRLEEARLGALELRLEAELGVGAPVTGELIQLVGAHPLRERLHELLMLALYRASRQAEALEAYQHARRTLVEQLGIEPGPRLRELHTAILHQDPRLDPPRAPMSPAPAFVGREVELGLLTRAFDDAVAGSGGLVLIAGEPGIGKSRLIDELIAGARGAHVLVGRCWEAGGAPAYWPWVQSLRALAASDGDLAAPEVGAGELMVLVPELRGHFSAVAAPLDSEGARFRVFEAVVELLRSAARERPIVLAIDDLHAADAPSLLLLQFLARHVHTMRILVVCAYRDVDPVPGSALVETLANLAREASSARLALEPLSHADVGRYVAITAAHLVPSVAALHAETDGNPLFMCETVRLMATEGGLAVPQTVRDVVTRRVAHLSAECGALLTLASVLGREFDVAPLERLAGGDVLDGLDEALGARVLIDVPGADGRLRFAHMVIRDTLYEQLTSVRRAHLHGRALAVLEQAGGDPAELAHHAAAAHDHAKHVLYAQQAGDRAMSVLAYEEAARQYRESLVSEPRRRCQLLLALGNAEIRAGDTAAGKQAFFEAAGIAESLALPRELARAAYGYGGRNVYARAGSDPHMVPLLERALEALGDEDPELRVFMLARLAGALRDEPSRERRSRLSEEAVELARRATGAEALAYALEARVAAITGPDTIEECVALGRQMEQAALGSGDPEQIAAAYTHQVGAELIAGDLAGAARHVTEALRTAHALRQPARMWVAAAMHAAVELAAGHLETAVTLTEEALALGERSQPEMAVPAHRQQRHCLLELSGSIADGEAGIADLVAWSPRLSFRCFLAHVHAVTGRRDEAARAVRTLASAGLPLDSDWPLAVSVLAEACAQLDDAPSAALLYPQIEPYAHLFAADSTDGFRGSLARSLGRLATTLERFDEAERHFLAAAADNERMGAPAWHALTLHDHGQMLLRRGERGERARRLIETAHARCERLGIRFLDE